jgi:hypothetical protein
MSGTGRDVLFNKLVDAKRRKLRAVDQGWRFRA